MVDLSFLQLRDWTTRIPRVAHMRRRVPLRACVYASSGIE